MSPLAWDLGHIAAYEDLWLAHRHAGLELLRPDLAGVYDAFETPRAVRGDIAALGPAAARAYMREVRERAARAIAQRGTGDGFVCEMVIRHELQHSETMRQTMALAGLLPSGDYRWRSAGSPIGEQIAQRLHAGGRRRDGSTCRRADSRWALLPTGSPTTTSARVTRLSCPPFKSPAVR